jgi:uncharacterized repeat protein (TIGR03803 family)
MTKLSVWKEAGAVFVLCAAMAIAAPGQTFNTLVEFDGPDGANPQSVLVQGADGSFYGTTTTGGVNGGGTVFKINAGGTLTTIYNFCSQANCADGDYPTTSFVLGTDGNFYGTTAYGGTHCCGTVFKLTPGGNLATLYSFCSQFNCSDGANPYAGVAEGIDGNFYGTTYQGGKCSQLGGCGTIFKVTSRGEFTSLYSFCPHVTAKMSSCPDGDEPESWLAQAIDGNFYGTTSNGGSDDGGGNGTVFRITTAGKFTPLYSFGANGSGTNPAAGLVQALDGSLYGTTFWGGVGQFGFGTVFKVTLGGTQSTLYAFAGGSDGGHPLAGLVQATDGNFYGTTYTGGPYSHNCAYEGCGTIFEITPVGGNLVTLHSFNFSVDGGNPTAGLLQATNGIFYGTTWGGGRFFCKYGCGTIFSLDMGLGPFVAFVQAAGKVGQTGGILGQGFTGTTSVSLNGTPASFTVVSDTFIRATVPAGATTGYVTVTTPSGALTSNIPFHVIR